MSESRRAPTRRSIGFKAIVVVATPLLYALSAIPMVYWHDSGHMPDTMQTAVKWYFAPLHWAIVHMTGPGNG